MRKICRMIVTGNVGLSDAVVSGPSLCSLTKRIRAVEDLYAPLGKAQAKPAVKELV